MSQRVIIMVIKLLASECVKTIYYLEILNKVVTELGISSTVELVKDETEINRYGVEVDCLISYCPGCNQVHGESCRTMYTPALVIDDEVVIHSSFPTKDKMKQALLQ